MDPITLMLMFGKMMGGMGGGGGAQAPAPPPPVPSPANNAAMATNGQGTLASMLGSLPATPPEPHRTPMPQTTFPEVPRSQNPEFSNMVMRALMGGMGGGGGGGGGVPSLGSLLGGR